MAGLYLVLLFSLSQNWPVSYEDHPRVIEGYLFLFAAFWGCLSMSLWRLKGVDWKDSRHSAALLILTFALLARLFTVFVTQPVLSDDIWRYIHDGAVLGGGNNPYLIAPAEMSAEALPVPQIADRMNNPGLVTIYQPVSQYVFAAFDRAWSMSPEAYQRWDTNHDKLFRFGFVLFDMIIIAVLLLWLRDIGKSPWWAAAYAWHPLAISEVAGSGHQDSIGIAFLVLSLWWASRLVRSVQPSGDRGSAKPQAAWRGWGLAVGAGAAFGLAVAVKPVVLPIALGLTVLLRHRPKQVACAAGAAILTAGLMYLPFMMMEGGLTGMIETGRTFVGKWAFNGSVYHITEHWLLSKPLLDKLIVLLLCAVAVVSASARHANPARLGVAVLFASVLLSSTVHPWYLLWALALTPICFSPAFWVFSLTICLSYAAHLNPEGYRVPGWLVVVEYLPVYGVLLGLPLAHYFAIIRRSDHNPLSDGDST